MEHRNRTPVNYATLHTEGTTIKTKNTDTPTLQIATITMTEQTAQTDSKTNDRRTQTDKTTYTTTGTQTDTDTDNQIDRLNAQIQTLTDQLERSHLMYERERQTVNRLIMTSIPTTPPTPPKKEKNLLITDSNGKYLKLDNTTTTWTTPRNIYTTEHLQDYIVNNTETIRQQDHIIIMLGTNDIRKHTTAKDTYNKLRHCTDTITQITNAPISITQIPPTRYPLDTDIHIENTRLNLTLQTTPIPNTNTILTMDMLTTPDDIESDGFHLSQTGADKISNILNSTPTPKTQTPTKQTPTNPRQNLTEPKQTPTNPRQNLTGQQTDYRKQNTNLHNHLETHHTSTTKIPSDTIRHIIGREGRNINRIQRQNNTTISIDTEKKDKNDCYTATITGTIDDIDHTIADIENEIKERSITTYKRNIQTETTQSYNKHPRYQ